MGEDTPGVLRLVVGARLGMKAGVLVEYNVWLYYNSIGIIQCTPVLPILVDYNV